MNIEVDSKQLKGGYEMLRSEKEKMDKLGFNSMGIAVTTTASGKKIWIRKNDTNINNPMFTVDLQDKHLFSRGGIKKVFEAINNN